MTPEERKEAARQAAMARWGSADRVHKVAFGSPDKPLSIAGVEIPAYVLDDGTRVLAQRGMLKALGMSPSGSTDPGTQRLAQFVSGKAIKPFVSEELLTRSATPIRFKLGNGFEVTGYEGTLLVDICNAVLEARAQNALQEQQAHIAKQCEILVRGFATLGIIALIDEATGYQEVRDRKALQAILEKYITDEWAKWTQVFPDEYYKQLFRLNNMQYPTAAKNKPSFIGHWTNDIVYDRLAPGILEALKKTNHRLPSGQRARKHHQHLTAEVGNPELKRHLDNIIFLMRACRSWKEFKAIAEVAVETNRLAGRAVDEAAEAKDAAYSALEAAETAAGSVAEYCGD